MNYLIPDSGYHPFSDLVKLGECTYYNSDDLLVFSCGYTGELTERSSKKKQYDLARRVLKEDFKDGALFIFHDSTGNFRFCLFGGTYDPGQAKFTPFKRYTYFIDPSRHNKTFRRRIEACSFESLDAIQAAFSVEPLSKQFYKDLSHWCFASLNEVEFPNDRNENEYSLKANAMIRLITRLMFVWFMKQKQLVPDDLFDKDKVDDILIREDSTGSTYFKAILQNLFFATLNTPIGKKRKWVTTSGYGIQNFYRYKRFIKNEDLFFEWMNQIPSLNGGLFENLDIVQTEDKENNLPKKDFRLDCFSDNKKNYLSSDPKKLKKAGEIYVQYLGEELPIDIAKVKAATSQLGNQIKNAISPVVIRRNLLDLTNDFQYKSEIDELPVVADPKELFFHLTEEQAAFYDRILMQYFGEEENGFTGAIYQPFRYEHLVEDEEQLDEEGNRAFQQQRNLYDFMRRLLVKRFESSFGAFAKSIDLFAHVHKIVRKFIDNSGGKYILDRKLIEAIYTLDEEEIEEMLIKFDQDLLSRAVPKNNAVYDVNNFQLKDEFLKNIEHDIRLFEKIQNEIRELDIVENDPKRIEIFDNVEQIIRKSGQKRKIIIFSEYVDTVNHLEVYFRKKNR